MRVYLAGSITGLSYKGCTEWREDVERVLREAGFDACSPMRGKEHLRYKRKLSPLGYEGAPTSTEHGIFQRDKFDVSHSDILFVNLLGAKQASIGSTMEIAWGNLLGKYIIVVMEEESVHNHAFILEASSIIFDSLDEAVDYTIKTFGGNR